MFNSLSSGFRPDIHFGNDDEAPKKLETEKGVSLPDNHGLDVELDYDRIFSIVKKDVKRHIGRERSGLGLALSDLPATLGAYWQVGGNYIVMNESLVKAMTRIASSVTEFNSYVYVILMHEYIHSLGYIDEIETRKVTENVVRSAFGTDHFAYRMSSGDIWSLYPALKYVRGGNGSNLRIVSTFDSSSISYIG